MITTAKTHLTRLGMIGALLMVAMLVFTQQANASTLLAQDDFKGPNQLFWGKASDGQKWGGNANSIGVFRIENNLGVFSGGESFPYEAYLGPNGNDMEAWATGTSNNFKYANIGVLLRVTPIDYKYYTAFIDGQSLVIGEQIGSTFTRLKAVPFAAKAGFWYIIDFKASGSWLDARVWQAGTGVPGWMVSVYDTSLKGGQAGIRVVGTLGTTTIRFSSFKAVAY